MNRNMGTWDRGLRGLLIAPTAVTAALLIGLPSLGAIVLLVLAAVMVATSATGFCPLYVLFGLDTRRRGASSRVEPRQRPVR